MSRRKLRSGKLRIRATLPQSSTRIRARPPPLEAQPSYGWAEISRIYGYQPGGRPKKLKLCADCDVPQELIEALRTDGIPVKAALDAGIDGGNDGAIAAWAKRQGRVLLTFNHRDFWNDTKHPLQKSPGMIIMAIPNAGLHEALYALAILYESFARHFTLQWWTETKVRVLKREYVIKARMQGRVRQLKVKYAQNRFYCRDID